jgi:hypothetical protein
VKFKAGDLVYDPKKNEKGMILKVFVNHNQPWYRIQMFGHVLFPIVSFEASYAEHYLVHFENQQ